MDKTAFNAQIQSMLEASVVEVKPVLALLQEQVSEDAKGVTRAFALLTEVVVKQKQFEGAIDCVAFFGANKDKLEKIDIVQMREVIRRSASTTEEKLFVDSMGLNTASPEAIVKRLRTLVALKPGVCVCSPSWGFGILQSIDTFYGKIVIDFQSKKGHTMSLTVAGQNLDVAGDDHIMTHTIKDVAAVKALVEKSPAKIVRWMIESYGEMSIQRLADRLNESGLVPTENWKSFWETARRNLKADKSNPVEIPTKRTESIRLLAKVDDVDSHWVKTLERERNVKTIYTLIQTMLLERKGEMPESFKPAVAKRLAYALHGAYRADYPRYVQVALLMARLGLSSDAEKLEQVEALFDNDEDEDNLLTALRGLAARDVSGLVQFILQVKPETKREILNRLPLMNGVALTATLDTLKGDAEVGAEVRQLLGRRTAPVTTLVVWALRNRTMCDVWNLPGLNELVMQAIHIIEQRYSGENLKMRNTLQGFFDNSKWLEETCKQLSAFDRQVVFERIQASTAWETSSQRNALIRMVRFDPELASLRRAVKAQQVISHITSARSLEAFKLAYDHLINVEIPANAKDIATARSYGDLRENAEYQFAKDQQRVLLSRQDEMDRTLRMMKTSDFSAVATDEVAPGTQVTVKQVKSGETITYTILGELDRDEALNIISCRSRLAIALIGKKQGDLVALPAERGTIEATIESIAPLSDAVRAWLAQIPTEYQPNA